ncbi:hypothetical protein BH10CYA1_BH10CYA1_33990 [soil metagenome]
MPNPEQLATAVKIGVELLETNAPSVAAKLPGLIELTGRAMPKSVSLLEPETRALIEAAAKHTENPLPAIVMRAAEKSGLPLEINQARIAAVRESLLGGSPTAVDEALSNAFSPRTYAQRHAFYGG